MYACEKQMDFLGKHCCMQRKVVILSNADLISKYGGHTYGSAMGWSFYKGNRPVSI